MQKTVVPNVRKTKSGRKMLYASINASFYSRFMKEKETSRFSRSLGINISLCNIPLLGKALFQSC